MRENRLSGLHNTCLPADAETEHVAEQGSEMETLFLSFWNICLDNLPQGAFTHRRIEPEEARQRIDEARAKEALERCTAEDLLAPYNGRKRDNHAALCRVLNDRFQIRLETNDFFTAPDEDGFYSASPLRLAKVDGSDKLLIITCNYVLGDRRSARKVFAGLI